MKKCIFLTTGLLFLCSAFAQNKIFLSIPTNKKGMTDADISHGAIAASVNNKGHILLNTSNKNTRFHCSTSILLHKSL